MTIHPLIQPDSMTGVTVMAIFLLGMLAIVFEAKLHMDKFKPALLMMLGLPVIALHYLYFVPGPEGLQALRSLQDDIKVELFSLVLFMAFMWMIVEILNERGVFEGLNSALARLGLGARGMFWATGLLSALLAPFLNNITTALIFGKSVRAASPHPGYNHVALCNVVIASNSGVWFLGTATSLMVVLAGKLSILGLLALAPAGIGGWALSALVLERFYLRALKGELMRQDRRSAGMQPGAWPCIALAVLAVGGSACANIVLGVDIEFAMGLGLALLSLYAWRLKRRGHNTDLTSQLQKVEWGTLMFFIGIITGVACLNHVGWLGWITRLYGDWSPVAINVLLGVLSGILDNVPVEAAALLAAPSSLSIEQWGLNALMVGIGGSLTVIGSAAGIMVMSLDRSYTFGVHLRFLPVILVNFLGSLGIWALQFQFLLKQA